MKSQHRARPPVLERRRVKRAAKEAELAQERAREQARARRELAKRHVLVNPENLRPTNSYGTPEFVKRGHYVDMPFTCKSCAAAQVWTETQQKWWYESAKGDVWTTAVLCRPCRKREQARRTAARAVHLGHVRTVPALLKFFGAVKREPAIDSWLDTEASELGSLARRWFESMRTCGDDVRELMHDGCATVCVDDAAFAYVNVFRSHVNVGFFQGATLADPAGLLEGTGRSMRHVKVRPGVAMDEKALEALIDAAYRDILAKLRSATEATAARS